MRLLLALAVLALALVAWLALTTQRAAIHESSAAVGPSVTAAPETLVLEVAPAEDAPRRALAFAKATSPATVTGPATRIRGRVVDDVGHGLRGALVTVRDWGSFPEVVAKHEIETDHTGAFDLAVPVLSAGRRSVVASAEPYFITREVWLGGKGAGETRTASGDVTLDDIQLDGCGSLTGRVFSVGGRPVANVWVRLVADKRNGEGTHTDEFGRFVLDHVRPGRWHVTVHDSEWMRPEESLVEVTAARMTLAPDLVLGPAPTIAGVVQDVDGAPLANIAVSAWISHLGNHSHTLSAVDGSFELHVPTDEPVSLTVQRQHGFAQYESARDSPPAEFQPGRRDVRIVLERDQPTRTNAHFK